MEFYGQYNDMECGIQIQNTLPEDTGTLIARRIKHRVGNFNFSLM